jgi:glycerophosphoryl diester phosphodiesterase
MKRILVTLAAVFAALLPVLAMVAGPAAAMTTESNPWLGRRVLNFAHGGGEHEGPDNTLFAFKTALANGADVLEMDVHATADGKLVALHDPTLDRTTGSSGRVDSLTLRQVKAADAAYWFVPGCGACHDRPAEDYVYRGYATGERPLPPELSDFSPNDFRIPTLREILRTFPDTLINIEIKATAPETKPYEAKVAALLKEFGRSTDTIVTSFNDASVAAFKLKAPCVSTAPGLEQVTAFWLSSQGPLPGMPLPGHHALQVPIEQNGLQVVTPDFVQDAHNNGLAVHVWTVNDAATMRWLIDIGVDGIMTNRPTVLEDVLTNP